MFGYCGATWHSVISPAMPPRPIVDPLAGGYRRIPVAQIGADIFCDTKLIADELANLYERPELSLEHCAPEVAQYAEHIDSAVFMSSIQVGSAMDMLLTVFRLFSPLQGVKFIKDRAGIRKESSLRPIGRKNAFKLLETHYANMESKLASSDFLFGASPSIADFSAFHVLWFKHLTSKTSKLDDHAQVNAWYQRMSKLGHGQRQNSSKKDAFKLAQSAAPRVIHPSMTQHEKIGTTVEISPSDYAKDSVSGVLVGSDSLRWIIARETQDFGTLHVHFPTQGFRLV